MATMQKVVHTSESFPVVDGLPLRLACCPDAIREHFDPCDEVDCSNLTDDQLLKVGVAVLQSDRLYAAFHEAIMDAINDVRGE